MICSFLIKPFVLFRLSHEKNVLQSFSQKGSQKLNLKTSIFLLYLSEVIDKHFQFILKPHLNILSKISRTYFFKKQKSNYCINNY